MKISAFFRIINTTNNAYIDLGHSLHRISHEHMKFGGLHYESGKQPLQKRLGKM